MGGMQSASFLYDFFYGVIERFVFQSVFSVRSTCIVSRDVRGS